MSFRTRKRGTPKQIGKKFPVLEKKKLPPKIRGPYFGPERYRPVGGVLPKIVMEFDDEEDAATFLSLFLKIGPGKFLAPEDYERSKNRVIIKYQNKRAAELTIKDLKKYVDHKKRKTRIVY